MTELTINIPDKKLSFFMQLAEELNFVVVDKKKTGKKLARKEKEWVEGLKTALKEAELHAEGKIKLKSAEQLLNEL